MAKTILDIFGKEYREETAYQEAMRQNISKYRLNDNAESVDEKISRLEQKWMKEE